MASVEPMKLVGTPNKGDAEAIIDVLERRLTHDLPLQRSELPNIAHFSYLPTGVRVESLKPLFDQYLKKPERIVGTAALGDERSFTDHVNTFRNPATRVFALSEFPNASFTAVYDYHSVDAGRAPLPEWQEHRAHWKLATSKEWLAWSGVAGSAMTPLAFAEFLEKHVPDVYWGAEQSDYTKLLISTLELRLATPSSLIALSRNLAINVETRVKNVQTLSSGEVSLVYDEQHNDGEGQPIKVPNAFLIAIPVIRGGPAYQVLVRLRYRISASKVSWFLDLHRADVVFDAAINEIAARVKESTGCDVFLGTPEK